MNYHDEVKKAGSVRKAARALGIPRTNLQRLLRKEKDGKEEITTNNSNNQEYGERHEVVDGPTGPVTTVAEPAPVDALAARCKQLGIDPSEVTRGWLKDKDSTIQIDRKKKATQVELGEQFLSALSGTAPRPLQHVSGGKKMLVIGLHDAHWGKLAWADECGENYDLKIAASIYQNVVSDALKFFGDAGIAEILLPIGSDFFHSNTFKSETAAGTHIESVDDRMSKVFQTAVASTVLAIDECYQVANVRVVWVPGNHDSSSSWFLSQVLAERYRNCPGIVVDDRDNCRKYIRFGTTLLGMTHHPTDKLPMLMATESPHWSECPTREWHTGHLHTRKVSRYADEVNGCVVRVLPSISATDAWHYENGFVKNLRAAEVYQYDFVDGLDGYFVAKVRS